MLCKICKDNRVRPKSGAISGYCAGCGYALLGDNVRELVPRNFPAILAIAEALSEQKIKELGDPHYIVKKYGIKKRTDI